MSTSLFLSGIARNVANLSIRESEPYDELDFKFRNNSDTFLVSDKADSTFRDQLFRRRSMQPKQRLSQASKPERSIQPEEVDLLSLYDNQFKIKTEQKITSLVSSLSSHLNEINEESNIKLSEIRQNFFISKLKWLEKYNHECDDLFNQVTSKSTSYDVDQSVKSKLEKVEKERLAIQTEIFKRRSKKLKEHLAEIESVHNEFSSRLKERNVPEDEIESFKKIKLFKQKFELLLQKTTVENLNETILHEAKQQLLDPVLKLAENLNTELGEYELRAKSKSAAAAAAAAEKEKAVKETKAATAKEKKADPSRSEDHAGFISVDDLKLYVELRKYKISLEESLKAFSSDDRYKKYRSELTLFVKTTTNTLSSNSAEHIRDKIERYVRLFGRQTVDYRDKPLSVNDHPDALNFCFYHAANSFLVTGLKQVLASTKSTYSFAQVMVALMIRFEEFSKILMAFFFEMCPYVVPFYPVRDASDNEITYSVACGYSLKKDGSLEDEESFLNKMRGLTKLYAAIIQIYAPNSPLNLRDGWKWLASVLNLEPSGSVSPAIIHSFLSITDLKLKSAYGKQFIKLIYYVKLVYLPKVTALNLRNPQAKVQLETYIDELMKTF